MCSRRWTQFVYPGSGFEGMAKGPFRGPAPCPTGSRDASAATARAIRGRLYHLPKQLRPKNAHIRVERRHDLGGAEPRRPATAHEVDGRGSRLTVVVYNRLP